MKALVACLLLFVGGFTLGANVETLKLLHIVSLVLIYTGGFMVGIRYKEERQ
jgi:hypothetical protein